MVANTTSEVDLILDDIRDTLQPNKNPDCTFTSRRTDKRIQERLIDISEESKDQLTNTVYSRDQEQSAIGWQNIVPYATYVDRTKVSNSKISRSRITNPVDNSTIVRHLQERIRKWADKKPQINNCIYRRKTYGNVRNPVNSVLSVAPHHTKPIVSAIDLTPQDMDFHHGKEDHIRRFNSNDREVEHSEKPSEKYPVTWNLLSHNEAAHMNYQTYGMDSTLTYVPDRGKNNPISNYSVSKQPDYKQQGGSGYRGRSGVLQPARGVRYKKRQPKARDTTIDLTEEAEDAQHNTVKYKDKYKCSICIEGLQVADSKRHRCKAPLSVRFPNTDWPLHIEYGAGNSTTPVKYNTSNKPSESLQTYKEDKTGVPDKQTNPRSEPETLQLSTRDIVPRDVIQQRVAPREHKQQRVTTRDQQQQNSHTGSSVSLASVGTPRKPKRFGIVIKDQRASPANVGSSTGHRRKNSKDMYLKGKCSLENSCKILRKLNNERGAQKDKIPTLYDRFHATKSGKRQRKMYGVSICDVYTSPIQPDNDLFNYGLFLSSPPAKQQLDPLINIKPLYIN